MDRIAILLLIATALSSTALSQRTRSALLPVSEAKALAEQCSRWSPREFTDTWIPSEDEIREMASRLRDIARLKAEKCCFKGRRVEDPEQWYIQFVGLVWKGKKIIYINAVSREQPTVYEADLSTLRTVPSDRWKSEVIRVCDGGTNWGVIYDPSKRKFSDLAFNGV